MKRLLPLLLPLLLAGCPLLTYDDDDVMDDDDSSQDDDDAVGGTCTDLGAPGVEESVPCDFDVGGDVWQIAVAPGDELSIAVDTLDPSSTFDPRFRLVDQTLGFLTSGDDECDCAWPPPGGYLCAEATYIADQDALLALHVTSFIADACVDGTLGTYVLRLAVAGVAVEPTLLTDDGPTLFGG
jgi:hypothetical protein